MSFQAYLDAIERKTGLTPQQLVDEAHARGHDSDTKAGEIVTWLSPTTTARPGRAGPAARLTSPAVPGAGQPSSTVAARCRRANASASARSSSRWACPTRRVATSTTT